MGYAEQLREAMKRERMVKKWNKRVQALITAGLHRSTAAFCKAHGIRNDEFCRWCAGGTTPEWDSVKPVEGALEKDEAKVRRIEEARKKQESESRV